MTSGKIIAQVRCIFVFGQYLNQPDPRYKVLSCLSGSVQIGI